MAQKGKKTGIGTHNKAMQDYLNQMGLGTGGMGIVGGQRKRAQKEYDQMLKNQRKKRKKGGL